MLVLPPDFDANKMQSVKGERLEHCPYQYLDYPKHFLGEDKFTFRSLCWWGHHLVFALLLEGGRVKQYKKNFIDRFHQLAGQGLELSLAPTLWEWKQGEGYTLPITHDRKAQLAAVLSGRSRFKIARFVPLDSAAMREGRWDEARALQDRLYPLHDAMFSDASPGPVKYALSKIRNFPTELRAPMTEPSAASKAAVDAALAHAGLI